jgi:hypothetical protein|tara:strand:+ start:1020 stop:1193 length:174 start_codon:yes stop_codon:yes gene_type:complete
MYELTEKELKDRYEYENQDFMLPCYNCDSMVIVSQQEYECGDVPTGCAGFDGRGCHR